MNLPPSKPSHAAASHSPLMAVLADIHGNLPALEAVITDAKEAGASLFLVAGDLVSRAPYPLEVIERLQELDAWVIRGNADQYQIDDLDPHGAGAERTGPQWGVVRWTARQLQPDGVDWLKRLPEQMVITLSGAPALRMTHGSPQSMYTGLIPENPAVREIFRHGGLWPNGRPTQPLAEQIAGIAETLLICGHTHIAWQERSGSVLTLNPGSVGLNIEGDPRARYALLQWDNGAWQTDLRAIPYDLDMLRTEFSASGLLEEGGAFARACLANILTGENVPWFFSRSALALQTELGDEAAAWKRAEDEFAWDTYRV